MPGVFASHERTFEANRYVYPVVSRRSRGVSVGINLNLDLACNFDCVYCQVDRSASKTAEEIDLGLLETELDATVPLVSSGALFEHPRFRRTPVPLRRFNDIAFSGNGEPTMCRRFSEAVAVAAAVRERHGLECVKLVLITNATLLDRDWVRQGLETLDQNNGEIWAKLDAGTEEYYHRTARSAVPFRRVLDNLAQAARARPIVVQTLLMKIDGEPPPESEIDAYCARLRAILESGGRIRRIQLHTVARVPAEIWVTEVSREFLAKAAEKVLCLTGIEPDIY